MSEELLITTFCTVDDFCSSFEDDWKKILLEHSKHQNVKKPSRFTQLALSELMTIAILFHSSGYRTFKDYYTRCVCIYWKSYFPHLVSYPRFVQLMKRITFPIFCFLQTLLGACSGISFIDSTILTVCHRCRITSHKVFKGCATRGKGSTGWFFGFKLHIVINHQGEITSFILTPGNTSDVSVTKQLVKDCFGWLFGDKGYISSKVFNDLYQKGLKLITKIRSNMKNKLMPLMEKLLLKRRGLIESVNNRLKNGGQIEHHRHRSKHNFVVNLMSGLACYQLQEKKPSIQFSNEEKLMLAA